MQISPQSNAREKEARTDTPTQFDLARWLFQLVEERDGHCKDRMDVLGLMTECMTTVRPPERLKGGNYG